MQYKNILFFVNYFVKKDINYFKKKINFLFFPIACGNFAPYIKKQKDFITRKKDL